MKKKIETNIEPEIQEGPIQESISELDIDFGREDLNKLKDKVNEIVRRQG